MNISKPSHELEHVIFAETDKRFNFYRTCIVCGGKSFITVDLDKWNAWAGLGGKPVQVVFSDLDSDQRELLINGTHADCSEYLYQDIYCEVCGHDYPYDDQCKFH